MTDQHSYLLESEVHKIIHDVEKVAREMFFFLSHNTNDLQLSNEFAWREIQNGQENA